MNRENLQKIADHLKTLKPEQFDMAILDNCVMGHTISKFKLKGDGIANVFLKFIGAPEMDMLTVNNEYKWLCHSKWASSKPTIGDAIDRIDRLIASNGEITQEMLDELAAADIISI